MEKYIYFYIDTCSDQFGKKISSISMSYMLASKTHAITPKLLINEYTLDQNEKLYFLPGTSVPRVKLKELFRTLKAKTTKELSEATKIIFGRRTEDAISGDDWWYTIDVEKLPEVIKTAYDTGRITESNYETLSDILQIYKQPFVLADYSTLKALEYIGIQCSYNSERFRFIKPDYIDLYEFISASGNELYNEDCLVDMVNGSDNATIDKEMYDALSDMFASSDSDNYVLAMEIMANSNYKESLYYLCKLFYKYSNKISDVRTRNHVNFKTLCNYMDFSSPTYCSMSKDTIVDLLMKRNVFSKELAIEMLKDFKYDVIDHGDSKHFKVNKITLSEEALKFLKEKETVNEPANIN